MKRILMLASVLTVAPAAMASVDISTVSRHALEEGWHWYKEEPDDPDALPEAETPPPVPLSASDQKAIIQKATQEALDNAILYPSAENYRRFALFQQFWVNRSTDFTQSGKQATLLYPELNYNLVRSHYNGSTSAQQSMRKERETLAVRHVASRYGVMFFYRGENPVDNLMAGVIKTWCDERGIALTGVTVDSKISNALPGTRPDSGQAEAMDVRFFPATFLVDPKNRQWQPLAWGFMSHDDLDKQVVNVLTNFTPDY